MVVVDDNLTNRRILADMLWGWGMLPAPAASGPEALAHMRRGVQRGQPYSLVLTDVHMPEMDGFELVKRIQDSPELTKAVILMLTSGDRGDDIARCRKLGVSAYLTKPVRRAELRAAIVSAIATETPLGERTAAPHGGTPDRAQRELPGILIPHSSYRGQRRQSARRPADSGEGRAPRGDRRERKGGFENAGRTTLRPDPHGCANARDGWF